MKTKTAIAFIGMFGIFSLPVVAQTLRYNISMPYTGLSTYSSQQTDPFSFTGNQAALANIKQAGAGLFCERRFMLSATSSYIIAAALPTKLGNFGIQIDYSGFKNFNENKIGLAYGRHLGPRVDIGVQFNYYGYRIPAYSNASSINFEAGVIMHFTKKLQGGVHVYNPIGVKLGKTNKEKLAAAYKAGLGYDASDNFFVAAEIIKEEDKPVNIIAGVQYHFKKQLFVRLGISSSTASLFFGAGVSWKNLRLDVAASYHSRLGFSPGILLIMNFKRKSA